MKQKIIVVSMSAVLAFGGIACGAKGGSQASSAEYNTNSTSSEAQLLSEPSSQPESTANESLDVYFKDDEL